MECEVEKFQTYSTALVNHERGISPEFMFSKLMLHVVGFEGKLVQEWSTGSDDLLEKEGEEEEEKEGEHEDDNDDDNNKESYICWPRTKV
jgi:hypothetical protein